MFLQHQPVQQHHTSLSAHHATPRWADHRWQQSEAATTVCLSWVVMVGTISSLPATLKGHYGPLTWEFSHNAEKLQGAQRTLAPWTQMDSGPRWTCLAFVCLCLMQPPSPMMPSSLSRSPSVWMCLGGHSHQDRMLCGGAVLALASGILQESGHGETGGGTQWVSPKEHERALHVHPQFA